jgi:RND family efflux transporter MFP subunit
MENSNKDSQSVKVRGTKKKKFFKDQNKKRTSKLPWIFTILVVLAIGAVIYISKTRKPEEPVVAEQKLTNVEVLTIKTEKFIEALTLPAIIKADRVAHIKPEFTGIFERWLFPEGKQVEIGDVIAEIDTKSLRLNLNELEAALKTASQNVTLSNISKEKTQINLTNMQENVKIQENALKSAESNFKLAKQTHSSVQITINQKIAKAQVNLANMQENVKIQENALKSTESNLKFAKQHHSSTQITVNQKIAKAQVNLANMQENVKIQENALKSAESNLRLAKQQHSSTQITVNQKIAKTQVNLANMQENVKIRQNALESAESNLTLAKQQHSSTQITVNQKIAKVQVNLANMQENVKIRQNALESAESNLKLAKKQYDRVQVMVSQNIGTTAQLDDAQNSLTQAELSVVRAKQNLNNALLNVQVAELAIKEINTATVAQLDDAQNSLTQAELSVVRAKQNLNNAVLNVQVAELVIKEIDTGTAAQQDDAQNSLTQAELSVVRSKQNLNNARLNVQVAKLAIKEIDTGTEAQQDDAQNSLTQAELSVVRAKQNLNNAILNVQVAELAIKEVDTGTEAQQDDAQNSLTQAELSVVRAKQNLNNAILNIQVAKLAIKEAEAGINLADARIVELEASMELLDYKIEKGKLKAPFSGILEEHLIEPGEMASPNASIAAIYDLKYLRATIDVPDRYIALLDPNNKDVKTFIKKNMAGAEQRINVKIIIPGLPELSSGTESGIELNAKIARIAQSSNPESNTFEVELRFLNPGNALKHGLIVRSKIEYLYYPEALMIPVKAIQVTDVGPRVLVVEKENGVEVAVLKDIKPVSIHGSKALIRDGLKKGDRLIVAGWKGLVGGEKINILVEDGVFKKPE